MPCGFGIYRVVEIVSVLELPQCCSEQEMSQISDNLNIKTSQPKLPGNRKYPGKSEEKVMIWKMIILNHMNDEEEVMTNDREEVQIYPTEDEEERATIEGLKDQAYLD